MSDLIIPRRSFLKVLTGIIAAPAVIKANQLMQVKTIIQPEYLIEAATESYAYGYEYDHNTYTGKLPNNMEYFIKYVMEGLKNIPMDIDKQSLDRMFTPQRRGLFS
jgi:hypothetical protein